MHLQQLLKEKKLNHRQLLIITNLMNDSTLHHKQILSIQVWYQALYKKLGERTKSRDLKNLIALNLLKITDNGTITLTQISPNMTLNNNLLTARFNK